MKGYSTTSKAPELETYHQMQFSVISGHSSYPSAEMQSAYSIAPPDWVDDENEAHHKISSSLFL